MHKYLLFLSCLAVAHANSQTSTSAPLPIIKAEIEAYRDTLNARYEANSKMLVHEYTFRRLIQKDFSKVITGENSFSKAGRFATLSLNTDESKFYFTPFVFVRNPDPLKGPFKQIHSIDVSGDINTKKIFELKSKYSIKAGYSFTYIDDRYSFAGRDLALSKRLVDAVYVKQLARYTGMEKNILDSVAGLPELRNGDKRRKAFSEQLADVEESLYADQWTKKTLRWWKLTLLPVSWDNFSFLDATQPESLSVPLKKSVYNPSVRASLSQLTSFKKIKIYGSLWIGLGQKHSLSEISSPSQWYNFKRLTDSTFTVAEDKKVYSLKETDFEEKVKTDFGGQLISIFELPGNNNVGFDISTSFLGIVTDKEGSYVNQSSIGIVFPFSDKTGDVFINITPFVEWKSYINASLEKEFYGGIRFALPINKF